MSPRSTIPPTTALTVEVDFEPMGDDEPRGRPLGRVWLVKLRSGQGEVVVAEGLGRPSADYLAGQIAKLLTPQRSQTGTGDRLSSPMPDSTHKQARKGGMN